VGKHGQLQEWLEDYDEAIPNHRHTSHLVSLYASEQITPRRTPELARAARVTIDRRLNRPDWEDVEWSRGNMINFFARLGDGDKAHESVLGLLRKLTDTNLFTFSAAGIAGAQDNIFVVDGNSAATAGIAEMLLQSHEGEIKLLPALPKAWPAGHFRGLRARGGLEIDAAWQAGRATAATLRTPPVDATSSSRGPKAAGAPLLRVQLRPPPGQTVQAVRCQGQAMPIQPAADWAVSFDAQPKQEYQVEFGTAASR